MSQGFSIVSELSLVAAVATVILVCMAMLRRLWRCTADCAFLAGGITLAAERALATASQLAPTTDAMMVVQHWRLLVMALLPAPWLLFSLTYARGNAGAFVARWRAIVGVSVVAPVVVAAIGWTRMFLGVAHQGDELVLRVGWPAIALYLIALLGAVLVLMNLERTFRAAVGTMRWRVKFVLLGIAILFVVRLYTSSQTLLFRAVGPTLDMVASLGTLLAVAVIIRGLLRSPRVASDVYPSLSVLQGSVTMMVAGAYLLVVGIFAKIVAHFGGDASFALKAFIVLLSLVGFAVLLQSDRVRLQVRRSLSRHFQRPVYDYRSIWRQFTDGTAACVEQTDLCRSVVRTTAEILQALGVSVWLVDDRQNALVLAASTSVSDTKGRDLAPTADETADIAQYFVGNPEATEIERQDATWANALRRCHPSEFPTGGSRICVPLLRQRQLVGVLLIGDRVNGIRFPMQDFDLLKCIADQTAASLTNIQMSQRLLVSKELEAFQTMAAFFVHDLKNAASTLNLMLQNLPVHYDKPEFRADALRAIGKTASHINRLTGRLSMLRKELKIQPTERSLTDVVTAALADLKTTNPEVINRNLRPVAPAMLDSEQLQKVITNLVLNAIEASPPNSQVRISTGENKGRVILTVSDDGCGMTPEFIQNQLFRPFQTTKPQGLGIGMFQSRMIVDAHGGRIQVASQPGRGTTFEVSFPAAVAKPAAAEAAPAAATRDSALSVTA